MENITYSSDKPVNQASASLEAGTANLKATIHAWRKAWEWVAFEGSWPACLIAEPTEAAARRRGKSVPNLGDLEIGLGETAYPKKGPGIGDWRQHTSQAKEARRILGSLPPLSAKARKMSVWNQ
jgi:hypothetical protein